MERKKKEKWKKDNAEQIHAMKMLHTDSLLKSKLIIMSEDHAVITDYTLKHYCHYKCMNIITWLIVITLLW